MRINSRASTPALLASLLVTISGCELRDSKREPTSYEQVKSVAVAPACPENFVLIPEDPQLDTPPFCVARYEMKRSEGVPVSRPAGKPWIEVTRNGARNLCAGLGSDFSLISNAQWQAIARNIERQPVNWSSGKVGIGTLNIGNFGPEFGGSVESNPCVTEGHERTYIGCSDQNHPDFRRKRTHVLSNEEEIWDIGGNAAEWVADDTGAAHPNDFRGPPCALTGIHKRAYGPDGNYERPCDERNTDGFGCIEGESGGVIFRGGSAGWENSPWHTCPGVFYANTNSYWNAEKPGVGFRCVKKLP